MMSLFMTMKTRARMKTKSVTANTTVDNQSTR
jgi:hypothetical protein